MMSGDVDSSAGAGRRSGPISNGCGRRDWCRGRRRGRDCRRRVCDGYGGRDRRSGHRRALVRRFGRGNCCCRRGRCGRRGGGLRLRPIRAGRLDRDLRRRFRDCVARGRGHGLISSRDRLGVGGADAAAYAGCGRGLWCNRRRLWRLPPPIRRRRGRLRGRCGARALLALPTRTHARDLVVRKHRLRAAGHRDFHHAEQREYILRSNLQIACQFVDALAQSILLKSRRVCPAWATRPETVPARPPSSASVASRATPWSCCIPRAR